MSEIEGVAFGAVVVQKILYSIPEMVEMAPAMWMLDIERYSVIAYIPFFLHSA